jgi:predicted outer membrane repeat protein
VSHNSAPEGAGIFNDAGAMLTVINSTVSYNIGRDEGGPSEGGGIDNVGTLTIHGSMLSYNTAADGGAICTAIGSITIDNQTTLCHNTASSGGAILCSGGTTKAVTLTDCTFSDNSASFGGAISFTIGTLILNRCTLTGNSAGFHGGAIYVGEGNSFGCTVTVSDCTITGNSAVQGGGIYLTNNGGTGPVTVTVGGCTVTGNSATQEGAGIYNATSHASALSVSNTTFSLNVLDDIFGLFTDGGGNIFS